MQRVVLENLMALSVVEIVVEVCRVCITTLLENVDLFNESRVAAGYCLNNGMSDSLYHWNRKLLSSFFQQTNSSSLYLCVR